MSDRRYTILSTASLPFERIKHIPDSIDIRVMPFIEILPGTDEKLKEEILYWAAKKIAVVFTSAHAFNIVAAQLDRLPDWKIYSVRNETRMAIEKCFGPDYSLRTAENAKVLSEYILEEGIHEAVFFCGDQRLDILPENLKKNGVMLHEVIVYETRLTPAKMEGISDAILFFSPTAVRSFFSMNTLKPETAVFAMGTTTRAELKKFTEQEPFVSPEADKAFVLKMAIDYAISHPII